MKLSRYSVDINIDEKNYMIYNTLSRKYQMYSVDNREKVWRLINNLNKESYATDEIDIIKRLLNKNIIIQDNVDELSILEFNENRVKYQDESFNLMVVLTLDCNFRCFYCYEEHQKLTLQENSEVKILNLVEIMSKKFPKIKVAWFGGEPLLQYNKIEMLSKKIKNICEKNNCIFEAQMTTNGYLFNDKIIENLDELHLKKVQITIDGNEEYHNKRRALINGGNTFEKIFENVINLLKNGIKVTLRINVDEDNVNHISELFDLIPKEYRNLIYMCISNLFQEEGKINLYDLYKLSIDKGYKYRYKKNNYAVCETCLKNGITIDTDGNVITCTVAQNKERVLGVLSDDGDIVIKNPGLYYKLKTMSALKNPRCLECIQLPICISTCKLKRYRNNDMCTGKWADGLEINDRALLQYYSDLSENLVREEDIV